MLLSRVIWSINEKSRFDQLATVSSSIPLLTGWENIWIGYVNSLYHDDLQWLGYLHYITIEGRHSQSVLVSARLSPIPYRLQFHTPILDRVLNWPFPAICGRQWHGYSIPIARQKSLFAAHIGWEWSFKNMVFSIDGGHTYCQEIQTWVLSCVFHRALAVFYCHPSCLGSYQGWRRLAYPLEKTGKNKTTNDFFLLGLKCTLTGKCITVQANDFVLRSFWS